MCKKIYNQWRKDWPDYLIQFVLFGVIGLVVGIWITNSLKPETDISINCSFQDSNIKTNQKSLDISFYNKADFA